MTKKEAKQNFGRKVRSEVWLERVKLTRTAEWLSRYSVVKGILIGVRTYSNGIIYKDDYGISYTPSEKLTIALIVPSWRSNPVPVPLDDCELVKHTLNEKL